MGYPTEITWSQVIEVNKTATKKQELALIDFMENDTSIFSYADFCYYAEKTGKTVPELRKLNPPKDEEGELYYFLSDIDNNEDFFEIVNGI
jgi:hypothetical protein